MILKGSVLNHKIKGTKNQSVWHFHCHQQTKCSNAAKAITAPPPQKNNQMLLTSAPSRDFFNTATTSS